jgi:hypothetical protein
MIRWNVASTCGLSCRRNLSTRSPEYSAGGNAWTFAKSVSNVTQRSALLLANVGYVSVRAPTEPLVEHSQGIVSSFAQADGDL